MYYFNHIYMGQIISKTLGYIFEIFTIATKIVFPESIFCLISERVFIIKYYNNTVYKILQVLS